MLQTFLQLQCDNAGHASSLVNATVSAPLLPLLPDMGVPSTLLLPMFILGVLAIDLTFDTGGQTPETIASYYTAHRRATFPANVSVIAAIVVGVVPLLRRLAKPTSYDIASFFIFIVSLVAFVGFLIPVQVGFLSSGLLL